MRPVASRRSSAPPAGARLNSREEAGCDRYVRAGAPPLVRRSATPCSWARLAGLNNLQLVSWMRSVIGVLVGRPLRRKPKEPQSMSDSELLRAVHDNGTDLMQSTARLTLGRTFVDDRDWHRPWPTTLRMFVYLTFMTSLDAYGTIVVGLGRNASATAAGIMRVVAECHVRLRWVLEIDDESVRRGRVMALSAASIQRTRRAVRHAEQNAPSRRMGEGYAHMGNMFDQAAADLEDFARRQTIDIPTTPGDLNLRLFNQFYDEGYAEFSMLSEMGLHAGPTPLFYLRPSSGTLDYDFQGMHIERAFWMGRATSVQLHSLLLTAPICGWECAALVERIASRLDPLLDETRRRLLASRDPGGWLASGIR